MKKSVLCASLWILLFFVGCAKERLTLQLNLDQGSTYAMRVTTEQKMSQTVQGQQFAMDQTTMMEYVYDVTEVDEMGNTTIKMTYDKIGFTQDGPMGRTEYRSWEDTGTVPMTAKAFAVMAGKNVTMELSRRGHVTHISGTESIIDAMLKEFDLSIDDEMKKELEENLKRQFGEEAFKETMNEMFAVYPDRPVGIGDTWQAKAVVQMGFPMAIHNTWRLKGIKDGKVYVEVNSKIEPNTETSVKQMGMEMTYDVSGNQKGSLVLDESTGWLIEADLKQQFGGEVVVVGAQLGEAQTAGFTISMTGTVTVETIEQ